MRISDWSSDVCSSDLLVINRPCEVGIEGRRGWSWEQDERLSAEWLETLSTAMANYTRQRVDPTSPICSTSLPSGERVQIVDRKSTRLNSSHYCAYRMTPSA